LAAEVNTTRGSRRQERNGVFDPKIKGRVSGGGRRERRDQYGSCSTFFNSLTSILKGVRRS
jgi:hypothetical protein